MSKILAMGLASQPWTFDLGLACRPNFWLCFASSQTFDFTLDTRPQRHPQPGNINCLILQPWPIVTWPRMRHKCWGRNIKADTNIMRLRSRPKFCTWACLASVPQYLSKDRRLSVEHWQPGQGRGQGLCYEVNCVAETNNKSMSEIHIRRTKQVV